MDGEFGEKGYSVVRSAIADGQRQSLFDYISTVFGSVAHPRGDALVPGSQVKYGDFVTEKLLTTIQPVIEDRVGFSVYPTYSYLRLYKRGDCLKRHRDRPACEISATLCLGYSPDSPWPIWLGSRSDPIAISLLPGDMLVYRGIELAHWREPYEGECMAQVFLHYVDQNGPHSEWKFDKRSGLGMPPLAPIA